MQPKVRPTVDPGNGTADSRIIRPAHLKLGKEVGLDQIKTDTLEACE